MLQILGKCRVLLRKLPWPTASAPPTPRALALASDRVSTRHRTARRLLCDGQWHHAPRPRRPAQPSLQTPDAVARGFHLGLMP